MAIAGFDQGEEEIAGPCGLSLKIPSFSFFFNLPPFPAFPPVLPIPVFGFTLSCDPTAPIDVVGNLDYGGSREPRYEQSADLSDT
jgi:hypothetical protein